VRIDVEKELEGLMSDPLDSVREWMKRSGYPLEFEAAKAFREAGFKVHQGLHYASTSGAEKRREIDVLAVRELMSSTPRPLRMTALWVIECKMTQAPWVVLHGDSKGGQWEALGDLPLRPLRTEHVLEVLEPEMDPWILRLPGRAGFRAVVADAQSKDDPYAAFSQVVSAARTVVAQSGGSIPTIAVPMVLIGGPLLSMHYSEGAEPVVSTTPWQRLSWTGHPDGGTAVVDLVSRAGLVDYATRCRTGSDEVLAILRDAWLIARYELSDEESERRSPKRRGRLRRALAELMS
jgi:hypothetical protein